MKPFNVIHYLRERDYLVTLSPQDNGVEVIFPEQAVMGNTTPKMRMQVTLDTTSEMVTIEGYCEGRLVLCNRIAVPQYAIRPYIMFYVVGVCERIDYSPEMIIFYNQNQEEVSEREFIEQYIDNGLSTEDQLKESNLLQIAYAGRKNGWEQSYTSHAEDLGVLDGYQLIRTVLGEQYEETPNFMVG